MKTIAIKLLEQRKIPFETIDYATDTRDAEEIAARLGLDPAQLFKTLVVVRDKGKPFLVVVPANRQLDLKRLAKGVGEKKLYMATHKEAEKLTRLQVGGISPLALINKGFVVVLDESADNFPTLFLSAGVRGTQIKMPVDALVKLTNAKKLAVTKESKPNE